MLYIMRHGRTDWNDLHKLQGKTDIPLNEEGRLMAENARETYKDIHFDVCYCSPLIRAKETAEIFLKDRSIPVIYDDRLKEMGFGEYEGFPYSFNDADCPVNVIFKHPGEYKESIGGAETFDELFARTGSFLKEIAYPLVESGKDVLIVGHGAMNSSIICQIRDVPVERFWSESIENCKLIRLIPDT